MHFMQFVDLGYNPIGKVQFNIRRVEEISLHLFFGDAVEDGHFDPESYADSETTHEQCSIKISNGSVSKKIVFHKKRPDDHDHWHICDQHLRRDFSSKEQREHLIEFGIWDSQSELDQLEKAAESEQNCLSHLLTLVQLWQNDDYVGIQCLLQEADLLSPHDVNEENTSLTNMHNIGKDILIFDWNWSSND